MSGKNYAAIDVQGGEEFERAGIAALVRAGEGKQWFAGHLGALMIAGSRLLRNPALSEAAKTALSGRLRLFLDQHCDAYAPLESQSAAAGRLDPLLDVLHRDAGRLRTSGHSTIYTTTALTVLHREPALASDRVIKGLLMLHEAGRQDDPARYFDVPDYFEIADRESEDADVEPADAARAFRVAISSLDHLVADQKIEGRHYFLIGEKIHLLTHAHCIATLIELGHMEIAGRAMRAQRCLARLVEPSRALAQTQIDIARRTPVEAEFWKQDFFDPAHVIKVAEAVVAELPRLPRRERDEARDRMSRVWAHLGAR